MRVGCTGYFLYAGHHNNYFTSALSPDLLGHPVRWICHHFYGVDEECASQEPVPERPQYWAMWFSWFCHGRHIIRESHLTPSQTKPTNVHKLAPNVYSAEMPKPFFPITGNWSFPSSHQPLCSTMTYALSCLVLEFIQWFRMPVLIWPFGAFGQQTM